jgi:hypothetical protein
MKSVPGRSKGQINQKIGVSNSAVFAASGVSKLNSDIDLELRPRTISTAYSFRPKIVQVIFIRANKQMALQIIHKRK